MNPTSNDKNEWNNVSLTRLLFHNIKLSGLNYMFILSFSALFPMEIRHCLCICLLVDQSQLRNHEVTGNFKHIWQGIREFRGFMFLFKKMVQQKKKDILMHPWALLFLDIRPHRSSSLGFQIFIVSATYGICCGFIASSFSYYFLSRIPVWLTNQYLTG